MKVSEMIAELQRAQRLLGDIDCEIRITDPDDPENWDQDSLPVSVEAMPAGKNSYVEIRTERPSYL